MRKESLMLLVLVGLPPQASFARLVSKCNANSWQLAESTDEIHITANHWLESKKLHVDLEPSQPQASTAATSVAVDGGWFYKKLDPKANGKTRIQFIDCEPGSQAARRREAIDLHGVTAEVDTAYLESHDGSVRKCTRSRWSLFMRRGLDPQYLTHAPLSGTFMTGDTVGSSVTLRKGWYFLINSSTEEAKTEIIPIACQEGKDAYTYPDQASIQERNIEVATSDAVNRVRNPFDEGFVSGILAAPFKARPSRNHNGGELTLNTGPIGPFLGYVLWGRWSIVGFAAPAMINVQDDSGKALGTAGALSYGTGMTFDIAKSRKTQLGILVGWDHAFGATGKSFSFQDAPWFSFSLGFRFLDY